MNSIHEIRKRFRFEAAHRLPRLPAGHPCSRIHGHSYEVTLVVRGPLDPVFGWVVDFGDLKRAMNPWIERLDHRYLNEIEGLENPTSEILAAWLFENLCREIPGLSRIQVSETCTSESHFPVTLGT